MKPVTANPDRAVGSFLETRGISREMGIAFHLAVALPAGYHARMLEEEDLERYRRMGQAERSEIFRHLMAFAWDSLMELPEEERRLRLAYAEREHALGNASLEERLKSLP